MLSLGRVVMLHNLQRELSILFIWKRSEIFLMVELAYNLLEIVQNIAHTTTLEARIQLTLKYCYWEHLDLKNN